MTNKEKLQACIETAVGFGWDIFKWKKEDKFTWEVVETKVGLYPAKLGEPLPVIFQTHINGHKWRTYAEREILFDIPFCKAVYGEIGTSDIPQSHISWQCHIQKMALAEDRIDYCYRNRRKL